MALEDRHRQLQEDHAGLTAVEESARSTIQNLVNNRDKIARDVSTNGNLITTQTTSTDATVAGWLQEHVAFMKSRVEANQQVRAWDPFFVALFEHRNEWDGVLTNLDSGVKVDLSASTECGQDLIEGHTALVSRFISVGQAEVQASHDVPSTCSTTTSTGVACFSSRSTVEILGAGTISMADLKVGDYVLTGTNKFEQVYAFAHRDIQRPSSFLQIYTSGSTVPLEVTGDHLLFLQGVLAPVRADSINVGDALTRLEGGDTAIVERIDSVNGSGIFAPLTKDGSVVVDGIVASTYADILEEGNASWLFSHHYIHRSLSPFRLFCNLSPASCTTYHWNGMPQYVHFGIWLSNWVGRQSMIFQWLYVILFYVATGICVLLEDPKTIGSAIGSLGLVHFLFQKYHHPKEQLNCKGRSKRAL